MRKRLLLYFPLALLLAGLLYLLTSWGLREYNTRQLSGSLEITAPSLADGDLHSYPLGNFTLTISSTGQDAPGGYAGPSFPTPLSIPSVVSRETARQPDGGNEAAAGLA